MAQTFTNTLSPAGNALMNRINPVPLSPLASAGLGRPPATPPPIKTVSGPNPVVPKPTGTITNTTQATQAGTYDSSNGQGAYNKLLASGGTTPTTTPPVTSPIAPVIAGSTTQVPPATPIPTTSGTPTFNQPTGNYANPLLNNAINAENQAVNVNQALNQSINDRTKQGIALPFVQGQQAALERDYGVQANAASQNAGYAANLAPLGQYNPISLYSQPYNAATNTYGGNGTNGAIDRSVQASNIGSAGDFQNKIQTTQSAASAADANFSVLQSYAKGFGGDTPIVNGLKQLYGTTVQGNEAISGFQAQLQSVRAAYQSITGGDPTAAIPDNITPNQLKQVQDSLKITAQNNITGYQNQLNGLKNGSGGNASGGGNDPLGIL